MMRVRHVLILLAVLALPCRAFAAESAYQALKAVGLARSREALQRVVLLEGHGGAPAPSSWTITLLNPAPPPGVRRLEVVNGKIVSDRVPLRSVANPVPINIKKLNLDSPGAFATAEDVARRAHVRFASADYRLSTDAQSGAPLWRISLLDTQQRLVGEVIVSAQTGKVIGTTLDDGSGKSDWAKGGGLKGRLERFSKSVDDSLRKVNNTFQELWDGKKRN